MLIRWYIDAQGNRTLQIGREVDRRGSEGRIDVEWIDVEEVSEADEASNEIPD